MKEARHVAVCAAIAGFALAFALPAYLHVRVLWYYPLEHRWAFEVTPSALAMDFFGRTLLAGAVGAVAGGLAWLIARRWRPGVRTLELWVGWAMAACLIAMSWYVFQLAHRPAKPVPLPAWYQPR